MMNQGDVSTVCTILYKIEKNMNRGDLAVINKDIERVRTEKGKTIVQRVLDEELRMRNSFISGVEIDFTQNLASYLASEVRKLLKQDGKYSHVIKFIKNYN